jgi:hypothetical protein
MIKFTEIEVQGKDSFFDQYQSLVLALTKCIVNPYLPLFHTSVLWFFQRL